MQPLSQTESLCHRPCVINVYLLSYILSKHCDIRNVQKDKGAYQKWRGKNELLTREIVAVGK